MHINKKAFVLDCDTGRDDALTLWICKALNLPLASVMSSYGNVPLDQVVRNNLQVLSLCDGADIPVFKGASKPLKNHTGYEEAVLPRHESLGNGLSNIELPSSNSTVETQKFIAWLKCYVEQHGAIDYVVIGPATNLAILMQELGSDFGRYIKTITMMGGKFSPLWDDLPGADFNILADPFAVDIVLRSGVDVMFVPMNVTYPVCLHLDEMTSLQPRNKIGQFAKEIMIAHVQKFAPEPFFRFHDPLVPFAMAERDMSEKRKVIVNLDENSPDFGRLMDNDDGTEVSVSKLDKKTSDQMLKSILDVFFVS